MQNILGRVLAEELYGLSALLSSKYETNLSRVIELIFSTIKDVDYVGIYLLDKDVLINLASESVSKKEKEEDEDIDLNQINPEVYYITKAITKKLFISFYPEKDKNIAYYYDFVPYNFAYSKKIKDKKFEQSTMFIPLIFNSSVIGLIKISGKDLLLNKLSKKTKTTDSILSTAIYLASISRFLASILDKQLDPLTKVSNRRSFEIAFSDRVEEYNKKKAPFSLLILDIDFFKKVNDTHGHLAGDNVLRKLSSILLENLRSSTGKNLDLICRWGGEEFIILLGSSDLEAAKVFAERLRKSVENAEFSTGKITISVGVVGAKELSEVTPDLMVSLADERLYKAKDAGRNRIVAK